MFNSYLTCVSNCICFCCIWVQDPELNLAREFSLKERKQKQGRSSMIENAEDNLEDNLSYIYFLERDNFSFLNDGKIFEYGWNGGTPGKESGNYFNHCHPHH